MPWNMDDNKQERTTREINKENNQSYKKPTSIFDPFEMTKEDKELLNNIISESPTLPVQIATSYVPLEKFISRYVKPVFGTLFEDYYGTKLVASGQYLYFDIKFRLVENQSRKENEDYALEILRGPVMGNSIQETLTNLSGLTTANNYVCKLSRNAELVFSKIVNDNNQKRQKDYTANFYNNNNGANLYYEEISKDNFGRTFIEGHVRNISLDKLCKFIFGKKLKSVEFSSATSAQRLVNGVNYPLLTITQADYKAIEKLAADVGIDGDEHGYIV